MVADLDEFWFGKNGRPVQENLTDFADFDLIYANWSVFGSDGNVAHPNSLRLKLCSRHANLGPNIATKWICRTSVISSPRSMRIRTISGPRLTRTISDNAEFKINHDVTQSEEYFRKVKMTRGDASTPATNDIRTMDYYHAYNRPCKEEDRQLADLVLQEKENQGLKPTKQ